MNAQELEQFKAHSRIQVTIKNVYGNETIYPKCEKAKTFSEMLGQKTFTGKDVAYIKALGFLVDVVSDRVSL